MNISFDKVIVAVVTSTTQQQADLITLQSNFPETPRLRGKVHVRTIFSIAPPPPRPPVERSNFPQGFNIGVVIAKYCNLI